MAPYSPRHVFSSGEPEDRSSRRRVIVVRSAIGLTLVGAALAISAVFVDNSGGNSPHPSAAPGGKSSHSSGANRTTTRPSTRAGSGNTGTRQARNGSPSSTVTTAPEARGQGTAAGTTTGGGTGGHRSQSTTGSTGITTTSKGPGVPATGTGGTTSPGPSSRDVPGTNPATASTSARALTTPSGFGPLLRSAWVAANPGGVGLTAADVQSTYPGSVYYAAQPSLGQYWSLSRFVPTALAEARAGTPSGNAMLAEFSTDAVFFKGANRSWSYMGDFRVGGCPSQVPSPVLAAWGICTSVGS